MSEPSLKKIKKDCEEEIKKCRKKFSIEKDKYEKQKTKYYYFYIKDIQKWLDASTSLTKPNVLALLISSSKDTSEKSISKI